MAIKTEEEEGRVTGKIELTYFRATFREDQWGSLRFHRTEIKTKSGRWCKKRKRGRFGSIEELREKAMEISRREARQINRSGVRRAKRKLRRIRRKKAKRELDDWLDKKVPVGSADAYKESRDRIRYAGPGLGRAKKRSYTEWLKIQLQEKYPEWWERAAEKAEELREKYDIRDSIRLL